LVSTQLGVKGIPSVAETTEVEKAISILNYSGGKLHFNQISSENSLDHIKAAKSSGLRISADVSINHLLYNEDQLTDFDTNFKLDPPLRAEKDRKSLIKGLKNGTIDAIVSAHRPQDMDTKMVDFESASFGSCNLPVFAPMLFRLVPDIPLEILIERITDGPRELLNFEPLVIEENERAELTLFNTNEQWTFNSESNSSKSQNSPLFGSELKGRCLGIINGKKYFLKDEVSQ
jgi:dihydroorotase